VIPAIAIEQFLRQERDDHRWMKDLPRREIDAALARMRPAPHLWPGLRLHQKVGFLLGVAYPQFSFWIDMGGGKSLLSLELLRYWFQIGRIKRAIVFVISDKAFPTWERQHAQYNIGIPYVTLDGASSKQKWAKLRAFGDGIVFVTYPGAVAMVSERVRRKGKVKMRLNPVLVEELGAGVGAVVFDESTRVGIKSLTNKMLLMLTYDIDIRYALAGRPFGRDPSLLWSQQYLIDEGASLGGSLSLFQQAFFTESKNDLGFAVKSFDKRKKKKLARLLQHRSITYEMDELLDLPRRSEIAETVRLPQEAQSYYRKVVDEIMAARGNLKAMENAFLRMRQLSSGFLSFRIAEADRDADEVAGERVEVAFKDNPKLELLLDLVSELPFDRKMVIFYEFTFSGRLIVERLRKEGFDSVWLWSGTKDVRGSLARFADDPRCQVCVVNNKVGAYSIDGLQIANYGVFYESPVSAIDREQAERRLWRQGQERRVFQYDLITLGTVDQKIRDYHKEGRDLIKALLHDPSTMLK